MLLMTKHAIKLITPDLNESIIDRDSSTELVQIKMIQVEDSKWLFAQRDLLSQTDNICELTIELKGEKFEFSLRKIHTCPTGKLVAMNLDPSQSDRLYTLDENFNKRHL